MMYRPNYYQMWLASQQPQQQPQQQQQMNPMQMYQQGQQFGMPDFLNMGQTGGQASGGFGGNGFSGFGGNGFSGFASAAGPWAALAAVIAGNETAQKKAGNRPSSGGNHLFEAMTGEVLGRDVDRLTGGNKFMGWLADHGNPKGLGRNIEKSLKPWELIGDLF